MNLKLIRCFVYSCVAMYGVGSHAALVHRYNFNDGTANDSIGTADGTLIGTASVGGFGRLNLTGGGSGNSYAELPANIATAAASSGTSGALSFEVWAQATTNVGWASLVSLGGDVGGDPNGGDNDYIQLIPLTGDGAATLRATSKINGGGESFVDGASPLSATVDQHIAVVVDQSGGLPGTLEMYVDGSSVGSVPVQDGLDITTMANGNNWLGRSQWLDGSFNGSYDEFRIYDHALTASEVTSSFNVGPDAPPAIPISPTLTVNRDSGSLMLQNGQSASQVVGYSIQSAFGSLDHAGWTTITNNIDAPPGGDGSFDSDDEWIILTSAGSHGDLSEFEFDGGDGGSLAIGEFLTISNGGAWIQSPTEDLTMELKLDDGSTVTVLVEYEGNDGNAFARSDLNFDGNVDGLDWPALRDNSNVDLSSFSLAEAYARGDLDGDGDNDYRDYLQFRADFDLANGIGAFEALIGTAVPEPCSAVLLIGMATFYCSGRLRL